MQSQDRNTRGADNVNHPAAGEWMAYLYDELPPERQRDLRAHAAHCATCGEQMNQWRAGLTALDEWPLPKVPRAARSASSASWIKWAAAAVLVLCVGYATGRVSANQEREVAELKAAVAQLQHQAIGSPGLQSNQTITLTRQTRDELVQLLADYSKLNEERRTEDRRVVGLALQEFDSRLGKLRSELETVALNTESGFRQTKEGLSTLATYAVADRGNVKALNGVENKN